MSRQLWLAAFASLLFFAPLAWGAPALQITVTVGDASHYEASPQTIPTATAYEADYGETVTIGYQILNTGDVPFDAHTLTDNFVGTVLNNFPYTLAPGASAFILDRAVATEDIEVSATWSARNNTTLEEASSTGSVLISVREPLISLAMTVGDASYFQVPQSMPTAETYAAFPGETITLGYTVVNEGTIPLTTHDLTDTVLGDVLVNFPYTLSPGASAFILQQATVSEATTFKGTWAAQTAGSTQEATATDTVEVSILSVSIELSMTVGDASHFEDPQTIPSGTTYTATPGETVTIGYSIKNIGEIPLTEHTLTDTVIGDVLINFPYTLAPGGSTFILAQSTVTETTVFEGTWEAKSDDGLVSTSSVDTVEVTVPGSEGAAEGEGTAEGVVEGSAEGEGVFEGSADGEGEGGGECVFSTEVSIGQAFDSQSPIFETYEVLDDLLITDVNVRVKYRHDESTDVYMRLESPNGTQVVLIREDGPSSVLGSDSVDATLTFDDEAALQIDGAIEIFSGSYRPEAPLSAFDAQTSQGIWTLYIEDESSNVPTTEAAGFTSSWSLDICGTPTTGEGAGEGMAEGHGEGIHEGEGAPEGEGVTEGSAEGEGTAEGATEGVVEGTTEGEGVSEGSTEGVVEGSADGEGAIEGEGVADGEGTADGEGSADGEGGVDATYEKLLPIFATAESGGNNTLTLAEIQSVLPAFTQQDLNDADYNGDGELSVAELLQRVGGGILTHADTNGDSIVQLTELLRLIQLFNAGQYACAENSGATEDGFALTAPPSEPACVLHSVDQNGDKAISLSELLRGIQLYNLGGYTWCPDGGTEDGFCG